MINKLTELLEEATHLFGTRKASTYEIADFLILNGVSVPPVKVGAIVKDKMGDKYIVDEFSYEIVRLSSGGITSETTILVIHEEDKNRNIAARYPHTISEFLKEFSIVD